MKVTGIVLLLCFAIVRGFRIQHGLHNNKLSKQSKASIMRRNENSGKLDYGSISEFCLIDPDTKEKILLTREEKERIFLEAIQSYYYSGKSNLPDDQFDRLREDLVWEGSVLVTLNRQETLFMNAMVAYKNGKPILSDKEFDELKLSLKQTGSKIAVGMEPTYYKDSGVSKVTWIRDEIRTASLYVPAALFLSILYLELVYEIPFVRDFFKPLLLLLLGGYPIYKGSRYITENFLFREPLVARGPCPKCNVENKVFFGDVLGVEGATDECDIKCTNCKSALTVKRATLRVSTIKSDAPNPPAKAPTPSAPTPSPASSA